MRQKLITLDPTSWDLAQKKPNFSQWVRDMLRSEDNKRKEHLQRESKRVKECILQCGRRRFHGNLYCAYHMATGNSAPEVEEE